MKLDLKRLLPIAVLLSLCIYASSSTSEKNSGNSNAVHSRDFRTFLGSFVGRQNFFENPLMLALSMLLLALPVLPFMVLGPIALAGVKPAFNAINNFVENAVGSVFAPPPPPPPPLHGAPGAGGAGGPAQANNAPGNQLYRLHKRSANLKENTSVSSATEPFRRRDYLWKRISDFFYIRLREKENTSGWLDIVRTVKQGLRSYDITERECQLRMICEINRRTFSRNLGSFADKLIDVFGLDGRLERSQFKSSTKSVLRTFLKAVRHGLTKKDCGSLYYQCTEINTGNATN